VRTAPAGIRLVKEANNPWYEVTLIEGRNREIRRMFEKVGHHVEKIKRVRYGPLKLDVPPGEFRALTQAEVDRLHTACNKPIAGAKRSMA
jgi:23S rRNA pseudouridine2605 synthase